MVWPLQPLHAGDAAVLAHDHAVRAAVHDAHHGLHGRTVGGAGDDGGAVGQAEHVRARGHRLHGAAGALALADLDVDAAAGGRCPWRRRTRTARGTRRRASSGGTSRGRRRWPEPRIRARRRAPSDGANSRRCHGAFSLRGQRPGSSPERRRRETCQGTAMPSSSSTSPYRVRPRADRMKMAAKLPAVSRLPLYSSSR